MFGNMFLSFSRCGVPSPLLPFNKGVRPPGEYKDVLNTLDVDSITIDELVHLPVCCEPSFVLTKSLFLHPICYVD